jgi:hypothetical protein
MPQSTITHQAHKGVTTVTYGTYLVLSLVKISIVPITAVTPASIIIAVAIEVPRGIRDEPCSPYSFLL